MHRHRLPWEVSGRKPYLAVLVHFDSCPFCQGWKIKADSPEYAALCHGDSDLLLARPGGVHMPGRLFGWLGRNLKCSSLCINQKSNGPRSPGLRRSSSEYCWKLQAWSTWAHPGNCNTAGSLCTLRWQAGTLSTRPGQR